MRNSKYLFWLAIVAGSLAFWACQAPLLHSGAVAAISLTLSSDLVPPAETKAETARILDPSTRSIEVMVSKDGKVLKNYWIGVNLIGEQLSLQLDNFPRDNGLLVQIDCMNGLTHLASAQLIVNTAAGIAAQLQATLVPIGAVSVSIGNSIPAGAGAVVIRKLSVGTAGKYCVYTVDLQSADLRIYNAGGVLVGTNPTCVDFSAAGPSDFYLKSVISSGQGTTIKTGRVYQIGDAGPGGGWVFYDNNAYTIDSYLDANGLPATAVWRYLEAGTPAQVFSSQPWGTTGQLVGCSNTGMGKGFGNAITFSQNSSAADSFGNMFAIVACDSVVAGPGDWYCPTRDELVAFRNAMWPHFNPLDISLNYQTDSYWTSTEIDSNTALGMSFNNMQTTVVNTSKNSGRRVLPIRRF